MTTNQTKDRELFERVIRTLQGEVANIGVHLTVDSTARQAYAKQIHAMATELRVMASNGKDILFSYDSFVEESRVVR